MLHDFEILSRSVDRPGMPGKIHVPFDFSLEALQVTWRVGTSTFARVEVILQQKSAELPRINDLNDLDEQRRADREATSDPVQVLQ